MSIRRIVQFLVPRVVRNWLRWPMASVWYVGERAAFALGFRPSVAIRPDWVAPCHPAARIHFSTFHTDPVQSAELDGFIKECPPNIQLLDLGAHYGFFSLAALRYGGAGARAVAVEPSAKAASILRANLRLNRVEDRVQLLTVAIGDKDGALPMLTTGPAGADYMVVPTEKHPDTILIPLRTMATIAKECRFTPTHVKIDVESFEWEALDGGGDFLKAIHPVLFLELHGDQLRQRGLDPRGVLAKVRALGYTKFVLDGAEVGEAQMEARGFNCRLVCR